jgi:hypothetical protein
MDTPEGRYHDGKRRRLPAGSPSISANNQAADLRRVYTKSRHGGGLARNADSIIPTLILDGTAVVPDCLLLTPVIGVRSRQESSDFSK